MPRVNYHFCYSIQNVCHVIQTEHLKTQLSKTNAQTVLQNLFHLHIAIHLSHFNETIYYILQTPAVLRMLTTLKAFRRSHNAHWRSTFAANTRTNRHVSESYF